MQWKRITHTVIAGLLGLALLVGLNVLAAKQNWRWDSTATKRYSLSQETADALEGLQRDVVAVAFFRPEERLQVQDLLRLFAQKTDMFSYEFVDPDRSPFRAKEYDIAQTGTVVLLSGDKQEKLLFPDEQKLVNGVIRVSSESRARLYFVTGHGESSIQGGGDSVAAQFAKVLQDQGADVAPLTLARQEQVPEDADALFILGPEKDFLEHELDVLDDYWQQGGRLFIALAAERHTNLDAWLQHVDLQRLEGFVIDPVSELIVGDPMSPLVQDYGFHPVTTDFALMTVFPTAAALQPLPSQDGEAPQARFLGRSTEQSWLETDIQALRESGTAEFDPDTDRGGPLWIAAYYDAAAQTPEGQPQQDAAAGQRAVVFADQDFVSDQYVNLAGNMDLARNAANWLMEREELLTVSKPEAANVFLTLSVGERMLVTWTPLLLLPGLCLLWALMVAMGRRKVK